MSPQLAPTSRARAVDSDIARSPYLQNGLVYLTYGMLHPFSLPSNRIKVSFSRGLKRSRFGASYLRESLQ